MDGLHPVRSSGFTKPLGVDAIGFGRTWNDDSRVIYSGEKRTRLASLRAAYLAQ